MFNHLKHAHHTAPWNKGRLMGQKMPLSRREIWSIRMHLQGDGQVRDLALFNLALDSKQQKTSRPVQFEITSRSKKSISAWISKAGLSASSYLFPSRIHRSAHLSTRQYSRIVEAWVLGIGLDASTYGTHSMRRTKATLLYRRTKNLRAVQLLLGHSKLDSTVRYLGIEIDALEMSEGIDV